MELHPILESDTVPNRGLWYVLSGIGACPSMRVGESCTYVPGKHESDNGHLYIIGGADPSGPFCDTYVLDLNTLRWDFIDSPGFRARYEHAAFSPKSAPNKIYIFGGADKTGNMNDIQLFDSDSGTWSCITVAGTPPSERTYHTNSAVIGDKFIVYSGGHCGADPVMDRQIYVFDTVTHSWQTLNTKGDSPKPRHGHVVVAVENKVYIHGGMSGQNFYSDIHVLDLDKMTWSHVKQKKVYPSARAGHSGVSIGTNLYIFGGMNRDGALDETWKFDTSKSQWMKVELFGPPPSSRLDYGMCLIQLRRTLTFMDTPADVVMATKQAQEVLDREMSKPGSASSRSSSTDLGNFDPHSNAVNRHAGEANQHEQRACNSDDSDGTTDVAVHSDEQEKLFTLCLIHGGMDTEGEVFDDTLVINLES